ncbi:peptidase S8/S53 domain-containing protein [Gamsiella multidivaricata]|uniref:peptidase S8/S53 domain-containing protein n=1 Tax=Gamsiella multidivaricata TaxID=101098 RepID=UPI00221EEB2E|nr:peptidase S8/S53 domain-containing protein [Gamsiella multidivaricata]KAI7829576.1 peptidase S8/S53 domain-containing protein [Gamsiella multidivaricata]
MRPGSQEQYSHQLAEGNNANQGSDKTQDKGSEIDNSSQAYVVDISKKLARGYDKNGRQETVNSGPGIRTTADGQTKSRTGPRGRQRGTVLPHKYIVRLKNGTDFSSLNLRSKAAEKNRLVRPPPTGENGHQKDDSEIIPNQVDHEYDFGTWKGYAGQFSSEFVKELESQEEVEYVEEDTLMWAWGMPSELHQKPHPLADLSDACPLADGLPKANIDSVMNGQSARFEYFSMRAPSWGLARISQHKSNLNGDYSYMSSAGADVDVYVIDSGVFAEHSDFEGRAHNLANFVPGEKDTDTCGHGTHVSGIVAGRHYGVAKAARIQAIKVLDSGGQGSTSQVLAGINFMIRHAASNPNRKKIINMSLGGQYSRPVNEVVRTAVLQHNLPFFVAAGNTGDDACQYSPAGAEEAFAVGGSDRSDKAGWYSCVGKCVNIFAPGSGIESDWIQSSEATHVLDGTSMASPHVAGVAALFLGAGNTYSDAHDLYADLIRYSTQGIIDGLSPNNQGTTRNLLYNKLEDIQDTDVIKDQDGQQLKNGSNEAKKKEDKRKGKKKGNGSGHHHHH